MINVFLHYIVARTSDIPQIACMWENRQFSVYTRPTCSISIGASAATGLTYYERVLKLKGQAVYSLTILKDLNSLSHLFQALPEQCWSDITIKVLISLCISYLRDFRKVFLDLSIPLSCPKRIYPKAENGNCRQQNIVWNLLGKLTMLKMQF